MLAVLSSGSSEGIVNNEDVQPPQQSKSRLNDRPVYAIVFRHKDVRYDRCVRFGIESRAREFYERLKLGMHPGEISPIVFVELSVRVGDGPREILAVAPEGGVRS